MTGEKLVFFFPIFSPQSLLNVTIFHITSIGKNLRTDLAAYEAGL